MGNWGGIWGQMECHVQYRVTSKMSRFFYKQRNLSWIGRTKSRQLGQRPILAPFLKKKKGTPKISAHTIQSFF